MPARTDTAAEKARLLTRCRLALDALARDEHSPAFIAQFRAVLDANANSVTALRDLAHECGVLAALLPGALQRDLDAALAAAGFDVAGERATDAAKIAAVRARGRIRSEAEYRVVQAYADRIAPDPSAQEEFLALGALLDEFASRGAI